MKMKPHSAQKKQTQTKPIPLPPNFGACSLPSLLPATPGYDILDQFTTNANILAVLYFWKKAEKKYDNIVKNA